VEIFIPVTVKFGLDRLKLTEGSALGSSSCMFVNLNRDLLYRYMFSSRF